MTATRNGLLARPPAFLSPEAARGRAVWAKLTWFRSGDVEFGEQVADGPTLRHQRLVTGVTILPIADLPRFLHDRVPTLHAGEITTLADQARRLYL